MRTRGALCEELGWDSSFFGCSIARAFPSRLTPETCAAIMDWCRARQTTCLYFLAAADDPDTPRLLEDAGFRLVDVRVTLERDLGGSDAVPCAPEIRPARVSDVPALRAIAGVSHQDTRFYFDGRFDKDRCDELYRVWIEKSCRGYADHVLVAERDATAAAYLTLHLREGGAASIGLFGVHPEFRGEGIGRRLLQAAFSWLATRSAERVSVVTAARNVAAQSLYQNLGFRTSGIGLWYHRWFLPRPIE